MIKNGKNGQRKTENGNHDLLNGDSPFNPSIFIQEEFIDVKAPSDGNNGKYDRNPFQIDAPEWDLGWTDGRYGQPPSIGLEIIKTAALEENKNNAAKIKEELISLKTMAGLLASKIEHLTPRLEARRRLLKTKEDEKTASSHGSSKYWSVIYLFSAVTLFLADIPLTVKLVGSGFGMLPEKKQDLHFITTQNFKSFDAWVAFLLDYWGVILLAMGLVGLGIFVKIFIDKIGLAEPGEMTNKFALIRAAAMVAILILYITTLCYLGYYREEQLVIQKNLQIVAEVEENSDQLKASGQPELTDKQKEDQIAKLKSEFEKNRSKNTSLVFILLTLLFPIIGGLCFSVGSRELSRSRLYREVKQDVDHLEIQMSAAAEDSEHLDMKIQEKASELEKALSDELGQNMLVSHKVNYYLHGYDRGSKMMRTLEEGESLYERCEKFVITKLAERARKRLWEST